jgi:sulfur oxidation c-type cytochrome SoxX
MRKTASIFIGIGAAALLGGALIVPVSASAQGSAPSSKVCDDKTNPPTAADVQGGCITINRTKGNCNACHEIAGITHGNIAPVLASMQQRFPDKARLRAQIWDASVPNPKSVMPPFGKHGILSEDEIDKVVEFLLTL